MHGNNAFLPRLSILLAVLALQSLCSPDSRGQQVRPTLAQGPTLANARSDQDVAALREELGQVTRLLQAQQVELQRHSARVEQLERELVGRQPPADSLRFQLAPTTPGNSSIQPAATSWLTQQPDSLADCDACVPRAIGGLDPHGPLFKIGGQYRVMFNASNFDFHPATLNDAQEDGTFFNQRFRTWLEIHTNELVSGYLQVEMGHILWGDAPEFPKTYPGPFSPAGDRVGVELRRGYFTYGNQEIGMLRAGIQDWHDAFGESYTLGTSGAVDDYDSFGAVLANSVWDFNVGGLSYMGPAPLLPGLNLNAGVFTLWEGEVRDADDAFLLAFDLDRPVADGSSIGFSVYYLTDDGAYSYPITLPGGGAFAYDSAWDLWIGLRANTVLARIPVRGFAIYNTGQRKELGGLPTFEHNDAALKLEAGPLPFGIGKLSFQTLYSTGDGNPDETRRDGFRTIAQSARDNFGSQGYWSYLVLTSPHEPSDVNDLGVGLQNRGLGLFTVQGKYDYPIRGRLSGTIAAGWLRSDARNPVSGSSDMGTELANMFAFDFGGGLTLDFGVAVLFTGDFYKTAPVAPGPDDLWEAFTRAQFEF